MAIRRHPNVVSISGLEKTISHLRSSFPPTVTPATLVKLGFAPKSEGRVISVLKFLGVIDNDGIGVKAAKDVFLQHDDAAFHQGFSAFVRTSYASLFELHGEATWELPRDSLIQFFRSTDESSSIVGTRQANTFMLLRRLSGFANHGRRTSLPLPRLHPLRRPQRRERRRSPQGRRRPRWRRLERFLWV